MCIRSVTGKTTVVLNVIRTNKLLLCQSRGRVVLGQGREVGLKSSKWKQGGAGAGRALGVWDTHKALAHSVFYFIYYLCTCVCYIVHVLCIFSIVFLCVHTHTHKGELVLGNREISFVKGLLAIHRQL